MMARRQIGWISGGIGALLVIAALFIWQGSSAPTSPPVAATTQPTTAPQVAIAATPTPAALSPLAQDRLAQPQSPLTETSGETTGEPAALLIPTVVVENNFDPSDDPDDEQPARAPVYDVRVVNSYPHDPNAFTQGLEIRDGELFEGTGIRGQSTLRRVDLETGEVLQMVALDSQYFGEGITVFEERIYQLTWQSHTGFVYDHTTFEHIDTVTYSTEGWGLTHDGERLIMSDGTATLTFRDPATFEALDTVEVYDGDDLIVRLNELEYINGEVWANVWLTDQIARIDPESGQVLSWLDLTDLLDPADRTGPDAVLNGIAYDADTERIFVTGKLWPYLFEIEVNEPEANGLND
jgi:glutaminyl-peptide cyclotransferase